MKNIAFLTKDDLINFSCDDELAFGPLKELGVNTEHISWHASEDWSRFDAVVVRSTWDYQDHYEKFVQVLKEIDSKTLLLNDLPTMQWNSHKTYLKELRDKRIRIIPTLFHDEIQRLSVDELCDKLHTNKIIFKPYVGANSDNTYPRSRGEQLPDIKISTGDFFVQTFLNKVIEEGEYSLFYFNGGFSHAILKTPKSGDYRVQEEWGGVITAITPETKLKETADDIIKKLDKDLLYIRVDLVRNGDFFELMELELIEPALYFRMGPESEVRFSKALASRLN